MGSIDNLTIIIPFFNGWRSLGGLLQSLSGRGVPVIIIDDHSDTPLTPGDVERITQGVNLNISVLRPDSKGYFTGAVNRGIEACDTDVLVLNQDTTLQGDQWLTLLAENRSKYALIGERITGDHPAWPTGYVHGTFMFMRRDAITQVGLLDEKHYPLWGSTCDWQVRICRKGYQALPLTRIPGFTHSREGGFGDGIKTILQRQPHLRQTLIQTPPLVSVIIPTHQHGRYLPDAIASLIGGETSRGYHPGQTFGGFEVIVVDDVSTDDTVEVMSQFINPWMGVKYIRLNTSKSGELSPHGTPIAQNTGIAHAYGRFITILNADDMMEPERLETLVGVQLKNPHSFVYDDCILWGDEHKVWNLGGYDFDSLLYKNNIHAGIMFPKAAWEEVGGYPHQMKYGREDWAFNIRLGVHGWCGVHVERPLYLYRRHGKNRTKTNTTPEWRTKFMEQLYQLFPLIYAGERPMACCGGAKKNGGGMGVSSPLSLPGADGFTILQYTGNNDGDQSWYADSGTRYYAGGTRRFIRVANEDVESLLGKWSGGTQVFAVYTPPQEEPTPQTAPVAMVEPAPVVATAVAESLVVEEPEPEQIDVLAVSSPINTVELTVRGITDWMEANQPDEATAHLIYNDEQANKARVTALQYIEAYIEALG